MSLDSSGIKKTTASENQAVTFKNESAPEKILLFSYAFPPMQVQMTAAVFKPMAAIARLGYHVDVLCADTFCPVLPSDTSLVPYSSEYFANIHRLNPPNNWWRSLIDQSKILHNIPDLMAPLHQSAYQYLMDIDLSQYKGIITWSPFHSINAVMAKVKTYRKNLRWIAQFSDPWAGNPLEVRTFNKLWNYWHQPRSIKKMDYLIHSSSYSLELMLKQQKYKHKAEVLPHVFSKFLYPQRPKSANKKLTLRYVGVLYGRRSPDTLFEAMKLLLDRRPAWRDYLQIELVGQVPSAMFNTQAALSLPKGMIKHIPNVDYIRSLELMYDADILLLIEADIQKNLFLASKVADYLGADTPIVGLVPPGSSRDILKELGCFYASPSAINDISSILEQAIESVNSTSPTPWCNKQVLHSFEDSLIAERFIQILEDRI